MRGLSGKAALVTGAASGIGRACALRLADEGVSVAALDLPGSDLSHVVQEAKARGAAAIAIECDVTRSPEVKSAVEAAVGHFGSLSFLVNSAGIAPGEGNVIDCPEETWDRIMAVNVKGVFLCCKYTVPHMLRTGHGAVVNLSSVFGFVGLRGECAYEASKGAIVNVTRQMALEWAQAGVRVNCLCPSDCDTPMLAGLMQPGADPDQEKARLAEPIPMGRLGQADEVAAAAAFLLSDEASFITGAALTVDGGFLAQLPHPVLSPWAGPRILSADVGQDLARAGQHHPGGGRVAAVDDEDGLQRVQEAADVGQPGRAEHQQDRQDRHPVEKRWTGDRERPRQSGLSPEIAAMLMKLDQRPA